MVKRVAVSVAGVLFMLLVAAPVALASTAGFSYQDGSSRGIFPHSGTQIAIVAIVAVVLLVGGIALWYFSHPRKRRPSDYDNDRHSGTE